MNKLISFTLLCLVSCGQADSTNSVDSNKDNISILPTSNPYFDHWINKFQDLAVKYRGQQIIASVDITFGDPGNDVPDEVAVCLVTGSYKKIIVDQSWWDTKDDYSHEVVLFHEMGHCLLGRSHDNTLLPNGKPESIMFPAVIPGQTYRENQEYYHRELFL